MMKTVEMMKISLQVKIQTTQAHNQLCLQMYVPLLPRDPVLC